MPFRRSSGTGIWESAIRTGRRSFSSSDRPEPVKLKSSGRRFIISTAMKRRSSCGWICPNSAKLPVPMSVKNWSVIPKRSRDDCMIFWKRIRKGQSSTMNLKKHTRIWRNTCSSRSTPGVSRSGTTRPTIFPGSCSFSPQMSARKSFRETRIFRWRAKRKPPASGS